MDAWTSFKRKREMRKIKRATGVKAGRGGRRATGGRMVLHPKEEADVHSLMAQDAQPNIRAWQMWDEACDFEHELDHFRDNLSKFEGATDEFLKRLELILRAPLPRVWDAVEGGLAEPTRATISHGHQHTVGGDASIAGLEEARSEYHDRLRGHVIRPLHQWSEALGVVEERLPELKWLRVEVVSASRAAAKSHRQYRSRAGDMDRVEDAGGAGALVPYGGGHGGGGGIKGVFGACGRPKAGSGRVGRAGRRQQRREADIEDDYYTDSDGNEDNGYAPGESRVDATTRQEIEMEEAGMRLNYKHRKLQAARADYAESEKLIAEQLTGLQRDAAWTKSYMVSALLLSKECMQTSVVSLGNTKQPLPGFQRRGSLLAARDGELKDNMDLAAGMPEDVNIGLFESHIQGGHPMAGLSAGGTRQVAALPPSVHAHAATAAPMELSARPDVSALDRLATPPTGAGAIPAAALAGLNLEETSGPTITGTSAAAAPGYRQQPTERPAYYASSPSSTAASTRGARFSEASAVDLRSRSAGESPVATTPVIGGGGGSSSGGGGGVLNAIAAGSGVVSGSMGTHTHSSGVRMLRHDQSEYVCGQRTFTEVEDRPIVRERVETIVEHRPVQKEYVTEVRYVGESPLAGSAEHIDTRERLVGTTPPGPKCPTGMRGAEGACTAVGSSTAATGTSLSLRIRHRGRKHRTDRCGGSSSSSSSSSWSSNSSSGDEREIDQQYSRGGSRGYSRQTGGGMGAHALPAGGGAGVVGGQVVSVLREDMSETVCDRKEFTQVENRPVTKERVETIVEHSPVQKEYITEVRFTGEKGLPGSSEVMGPAQERVVHVGAPGPKCPNNICQADCSCDPVTAAPAGVEDAAGYRGQQQMAAV